MTDHKPKKENEKMKATMIIKNKVASFDFRESSDMTYDEMMHEINVNEVTHIEFRARGYDLNEDGLFEDVNGKVLKLGVLFS